MSSDFFGGDDDFDFFDDGGFQQNEAPEEDADDEGESIVLSEDEEKKEEVTAPQTIVHRSYSEQAMFLLETIKTIFEAGAVENQLIELICNGNSGEDVTINAYVHNHEIIDHDSGRTVIFSNEIVDAVKQYSSDDEIKLDIAHMLVNEFYSAEVLSRTRKFVFVCRVPDHFYILLFDMKLTEGDMPRRNVIIIDSRTQPPSTSNEKSEYKKNMDAVLYLLSYFFNCIDRAAIVPQECAPSVLAQQGCSRLCPLFVVMNIVCITADMPIIRENMSPAIEAAIKDAVRGICERASIPKEREAYFVRELHNRFTSTRDAMRDIENSERLERQLQMQNRRAEPHVMRAPLEPKKKSAVVQKIFTQTQNLDSSFVPVKSDIRQRIKNGNVEVYIKKGSGENGGRLTDTKVPPPEQVQTSITDYYSRKTSIDKPGGRESITDTLRDALDMETHNNSLYEDNAGRCIDMFYRGGKAALIAPTGSGKTRIDMSFAVLSAMENSRQYVAARGDSDNMKQPHHLTIIVAPYRVICSSFYMKLCKVRVGGRPIVGNLLTGDNTKGNGLGLRWRRKAVFDYVDVMPADYASWFDDVYKKVANFEGAQSSKADGEKKKIIDVNLKCDFIVGTFEMVLALVKQGSVTEAIKKKELILHTVVDEFQESSKAHGKRFITAASVFDYLHEISSSMFLSSGSYSLLKTPKYKFEDVFEGFGLIEAATVPKVFHRLNRRSGERAAWAKGRLLEAIKRDIRAKDKSFSTAYSFIQRYPEFVTAADFVCHPNKGCFALMMNDTKRTDETIEMIFLVIFTIQRRCEYEENNPVAASDPAAHENAKRTRLLWRVPIYGARRFAGNNFWASATSEEGESERDRHIDIEVEQYSSRDKGFVMKSFKTTIAGARNGIMGDLSRGRIMNTKEDGYGEDEAFIESEEHWKKRKKALWDMLVKIRKENSDIKPRFMCNSPSLTNFVKYGTKNVLSQNSKKEISGDIYIECYDALEANDETAPERFSRLSMEKALMADTEVINIQNVKNLNELMLRSGIVKNNAHENYSNQLEDELLRLRRHPRVWLATQKIGVGADMNGIRAIAILEGPSKYLLLHDELRDQIAGRVDRERVGRISFSEQLDLSKEAAYEQKKYEDTREHYLGAENMKDMVKYSLSVKDDLQGPIINFVRKQIEENADEEFEIVDYIPTWDDRIGEIGSAQYDVSARKNVVKPLTQELSFLENREDTQSSLREIIKIHTPNVIAKMTKKGKFVDLVTHSDIFIKKFEIKSVLMSAGIDCDFDSADEFIFPFGCETEPHDTLYISSAQYSTIENEKGERVRIPQLPRAFFDEAVERKYIVRTLVYSKSDGSVVTAVPYDREMLKDTVMKYTDIVLGSSDPDREQNEMEVNGDIQALNPILMLRTRHSGLVTYMVNPRKGCDFAFNVLFNMNIEEKVTIFHMISSIFSKRLIRLDDNAPNSAKMGYLIDALRMLQAADDNYTSSSQYNWESVQKNIDTPKHGMAWSDYFKIALFLVFPTPHFEESKYIDKGTRERRDLFVMTRNIDSEDCKKIIADTAYIVEHLRKLTLCEANKTINNSNLIGDDSRAKTRKLFKATISVAKMFTSKYQHPYAQFISQKEQEKNFMVGVHAYNYLAVFLGNRFSTLSSGNVWRIEDKLNVIRNYYMATQEADIRIVLWKRGPVVYKEFGPMLDKVYQEEEQRQAEEQRTGKSEDITQNELETAVVEERENEKNKQIDENFGNADDLREEEDKKEKENEEAATEEETEEEERGTFGASEYVYYEGY